MENNCQRRMRVELEHAMSPTPRQYVGIRDFETSHRRMTIIGAGKPAS